MTIEPIKFEIIIDDSKHALPRVVATYPDGHKSSWGDPNNLRGAKIILSKHAKKYGMTKSKDCLSAE
ncbi:hypothetical protein ACRZ5S_22975 (plasmid) [Vibrio scophthalmi]|uniref:hypothetical protein n=1 Tax=Vibrio scophthalmi TaxID=45658 RepID=UPI003EBD179C